MTSWDGVTDGTKMTEWEWLDCTDPQPMLKFLRKKVINRELHLFAEACRGRVTNLSRDECRPQALLRRDIFGNPFHGLPPRPEPIVPLAEQVYQGRWDLIPLLGEWLQEHGYWSEGELCLDPNIRHVKGCWVVDWVTGRE